MLALEGTIMVVMLSAFSLDVVAYAFVGQIIYINCMNYMVFNLGPKLYEVEIICDHPGEIERFIIDEIHKSATIDQVIGSLLQEPKTQLDCVCNSRSTSQLREFMRDQGFDCFIKVYPLTHVFGHNKDFHRLDDENLEVIHTEKSRGRCRGILGCRKSGRADFFELGCTKFSPRFLAKLSAKIL